MLARRRALTIDFVGDVMLGGGVADVVRERGADAVFAEVRPWLDSADAVVGNLECVLSARGTPTTAKSAAAVADHREWLLRGDPRGAPALARAGFAAMTLANNHSLDYGPQAMDDTLAALRAAGIAATGAGDDLAQARRPAVFMRDGIRVAILGVSEILPRGEWATATRPGVAPGRGLAVTSIGPGFVREMARRVRAARARADVVVVFEHWGTELVSRPTPDQVRFAHAMIDAGAQLVVGAHPHVLGPLERYRGGLIAYSLGNFVFDTEPGVAARSAVLRVRFVGGRLVAWEALPVVIAGGAPHPAGVPAALDVAGALGAAARCVDGLRMPGVCGGAAGSRRTAVHHLPGTSS